MQTLDALILAASTTSRTSAIRSPTLEQQPPGPYNFLEELWMPTLWPLQLLEQTLDANPLAP